MNQTVRPPKAKRIGFSACPHDCPSTCALDVELIDERTIGRVHGAKDNDYTAGVICAKVARYAERVHHPDRLLHPLRRKGPKGSGEFAAHLLGRRARPRRRGLSRGRAAPRRRRRLALLLRRHHGPGACATASTGCATPSAIPASIPPSAPTPPGPALSPAPAARRRRPARDGEVRSGRDLGHQCGRTRRST